MGLVAFGDFQHEAMNPGTGGSTVWAVWACLGGCRLLWQGVHATQVRVREGLPFGGGYVRALGRTTVLSEQGSAAQQCHTGVTKPISR